VVGDGSSELAVNTDDWELATIIPALESGVNTGLHQQGMVAVYTYANGRFSNTAALNFCKKCTLSKRLSGGITELKILERAIEIISSVLSIT
jgi:hypothetical protein